MEPKLVIFDMNGTLTNTPWIDKEPLHLLPGRKERLAELREQGIHLAVASNQGPPLWFAVTGNPKYQTAGNLCQEIKPLIEELGNIPWYISLYHQPAIDLLQKQIEQEILAASEVGSAPEYKDPLVVLVELQQEMKLDLYHYDIVIGIKPEWRKPAPGMITAARNTYYIEAGETLYVGDRYEDLDAAKAAGVAFQSAIQFFGDPIDPARDYAREGTIVYPGYVDPYLYHRGEKHF